MGLQVGPGPLVYCHIIVDQTASRPAKSHINLVDMVDNFSIGVMTRDQPSDIGWLDLAKGSFCDSDLLMLAHGPLREHIVRSGVLALQNRETNQ